MTVNHSFQVHETMEIRPMLWFLGLMDTYFDQKLTFLQQTLFAVPLSCDSCVKDVSDSVYKLPGITKVDANLTEQLISVQGSGMFDGTNFKCRLWCEANKW